MSTLPLALSHRNHCMSAHPLHTFLPHTCRCPAKPRGSCHVRVCASSELVVEEMHMPCPRPHPCASLLSTQFIHHLSPPPLGLSFKTVFIQMQGGHVMYVFVPAVQLGAKLAG